MRPTRQCKAKPLLVAPATCAYVPATALAGSTAQLGYAESASLRRHTNVDLVGRVTGHRCSPQNPAQNWKGFSGSPMDQVDRAVVEEAQGILDMNWVSDRIAVGGWVETEEKMRAVAQLGITHIIDMAWEHDDTPEAAKYGIKVLLNTTDDDFQPKGTELLERGVEFALEALRQPGSKLFIHCVAGRHRGPMMTLAVFCALGWGLEDAMRHISQRRPIVDWSPVYVDSVKAFLQEYNRERPHQGASSSQSPLAA